MESVSIRLCGPNIELTVPRTQAWKVLRKWNDWARGNLSSGAVLHVTGKVDPHDTRFIVIHMLCSSVDGVIITLPGDPQGADENEVEDEAKEDRGEEESDTFTDS